MGCEKSENIRENLLRGLGWLSCANYRKQCENSRGWWVELGMQSCDVKIPGISLKIHGAGKLCRENSRNFSENSRGWWVELGVQSCAVKIPGISVKIHGAGGMSWACKVVP